MEKGIEGEGLVIMDGGMVEAVKEEPGQAEAVM